MQEIYGTLAIALIAIGILTATDSAEACLPPDPSWSVSESAPDEIPVGGALPFVMTGVETQEKPTLAEGVTISVVDSEGMAVDGSSWTYELYGHEEGSYSREWLLAWRPDDGWTAGASYTLEVNIDFQEATDPARSELTHTFTVRETDSDPSAGQIVDQSLRVDERTVRESCCDVPDCMRNCVDNCRRCWPTELAYQPVLTNTVAIPDSIWATQLLVRRHNANGYWQVSAGHEAIVAVDANAHEGEFCAVPRAILIADESEVSGDPECLPEGDLPDYQEREASEVWSPPSECELDEMPDDQDAGSSADVDPAQTDAGIDVGGDDGAGQDNRSGCSHGPGDETAPPLAIIGALLLLFARSRRAHA